MGKYFKFVLTGTLGGGTYYNIGKIIAYDKNGTNIPLSYSNIVSETFVNRHSSSDWNNAVFTLPGVDNAPYSSSNGTYNSIILNVSSLSDISLFRLRSYVNDGSARYCEVYYSSDNVNYTLVASLEWSAAAQWNTIYADAKSSILDVTNIGDKVQCEYYSFASNVVGYLGKVGPTSKYLIPHPSYPYGTGSFYAIYIGDDPNGNKLFMSDRNLQNSIGWNKIDAVGIASSIDGDVNNLRIDTLMTAAGVNGTATATNAQSGYEAWRIFDTNSSTFYSNGGAGGVGSVERQLLNSAIVVEYDILARSDAGTHAPKNWTFEGYNSSTSSWEILDTRSGITFANGELKSFRFNNEKSYSRYRLNITATGSNSYINIAEMNFFTMINNHEIRLRLPSGGNSSADTNNEWSQYIVNSNFLGTLTSSIWHTESIWSWTSNVSGSNRMCRGYYTPLNSTSAYQWQSYTQSIATTGFRPILMLVELNNKPVVSVNIDKTVVRTDTVSVTGTISDEDLDQLKYTIKVNGQTALEYGNFQDGPVGVDFVVTNNYFTLSLNTLEVISMDSRNGITTVTFTVKKKNIDIVHVSSTDPDTNFNNSDTLYIDSNRTILVKTPEITKVYGYVRDALVELNIRSGNVGKVKVARVLGAWNPSNVTFNSLPSIDTEFVECDILGTGAQTLDVENIANLIWENQNYGLAIMYVDTDLQVEPLDNTVNVTYQATKLNPPSVVYGNRVRLDWKTVILPKIAALDKIRIIRSTDPTFTSYEVLYETTDISVLYCEDTTISEGTYYYRAEVFQINNPINGTIDYDQSTEPEFIQQDEIVGTDFINGKVQTHSTPASVNNFIDFNSDVGYVYDNTKVEVKSGKIQLKNLVV